MKYKTALVTGGAGFIGSHLVDALVARRIKVFVVDDLSTGQKSNLNPNAHFTKLSISSPAFGEYLKKVKPEIIFHLAAQINVRTSVEDPSADALTNILGTLTIAKLAKEVGVKKIIFSSSGGAIYSQEAKAPYNESSHIDPLSPYGISKRAAEMYFSFVKNVHGVPTVSLRYANVYGPRQNAKGEAGVISIFSTRMLQNKPIVVNGTGKQTRDFVFVTDVVRANLLAAAKNVAGEFNVGTGKETSVNALVKKLAKLTGYAQAATHGPAAKGEVMRSVLSARKAKEVLGWAPKVSLDEGLKKTVESFRKNR